ncbi:hypothetical protein DTO013E5_908 [Penicillium roqueforti]|uniref:Genomic scaffold, ProqFM164S01 n=1 Tax=Penicillium roqueforti (strain FM164) TaxID=1365484 RepID=W6PXI5_PENRF|nr:hypothetical protein LCP963914a_3295 [Penicillium roqueforti]CDM28660.1 unnamed protein product [Penicillium roqueforti FM164]KAI2744278.1 hypothetical protein DTO013F2_7831 [Penicillium roqueforti]KAI2747630.1 hypothetical protein DTO012A1_276 [Penicillium roqueforti]KAI2774871.1 hypothetical protein DTO012A8_356 [Penicillium roqueforti]
MSRMRLRDSIRAPVRYGEDEYEASRVSLRQGCDDSIDDSMELGETGKPRPQQGRKPNTVPFNPNLPPAAFPTLNIPQPGRGSSVSAHNRGVGGSRQNVHASEATSAFRNDRSVPSPPSGNEELSMDDIDNHLASNNMDNPVYARNVNLARMSVDAFPGSEDIDMDMATSPDSDDDPLPDATQVLLDTIPNPKWGDLHKAMQVEIIENIMKFHSWRRVCDLLGLGLVERRQLMINIGIRNKQIERENEILEKMRHKQRRALMRIDNSDLKLFKPPPQLVLKRITREAHQNLLVTGYTDLLMCQSHEFLKARQFLHQHGLPRRYAGDWGDSLVVLRESGEHSHEPDEFEWKENLRVTPPPDETEDIINPFMDPASRAKSQFIQSIGMHGTINPRDLIKRDTDPAPIVDWGKYYKRKPDLSWDTTKPQLNGLVKVKVGPHNAARIQHCTDAGVELQGLSSQTQVTAMPGSLPQGSLQDTPSKEPRNASLAQPFFRRPARPFRRVLTDWSSPVPHQSESQSKYRRDIQQAKLEKLEAKAEGLRRRYNYQPNLQVKGVGVGISPARGIIQMMPPMQPVEEETHSKLFARTHRGMTNMNIDRLMDEFIELPEESEPELPDAKPTSTDISSTTEVSMDDVMLVPTDGCSSSPQ